MGKNEKTAIAIVIFVVIFLVAIRDRHTIDNTNDNVQQPNVSNTSK